MPQKDKNAISTFIAGISEMIMSQDEGNGKMVVEWVGEHA